MQNSKRVAKKWLALTLRVEILAKDLSHAAAAAEGREVRRCAHSPTAAAASGATRVNFLVEM